MTPTRSEGSTVTKVRMTPTQIKPGSVRDKVEKFESNTTFVPQFSLLMNERRTPQQKPSNTASIKQVNITPIVKPYIEPQEQEDAFHKPVIMRRRSQRLAKKIQQLSPLPCNSPGIKTFSLRSGKPRYNLLTDQTNSPTVARTNSLDRGTPRKVRYI